MSIEEKRRASVLIQKFLSPCPALIDDWVVNGVKPPEQVTLTNRVVLPPYDIVASKPMCRYGFDPRYVGATTVGGNLATNYTCTAP